MSNEIDKSEETSRYSADVGSIIDNEDCTVKYDHFFQSEIEASNKLLALTKMAREIESEPCHIMSSITPSENGYNMKAKFVFCCGTESLIFQLKLR